MQGRSDLDARSRAVFTARCYASAVLAMALCLSIRPSVCLSVCPSVCLSQVGVLLKRQNVGSHKQHHTIAQGLVFGRQKISAKFDRDHPAKCRWGGSKSATFDKWLVISRKRYKIDAWFLLKSNRKSYALYQMVTLPMTLSAP